VRVPLPPGVDRRAVDAALRALPGVLDVVIAESTAGIWFDPLGEPPDLGDALSARGVEVAPTEHVVPVRYDGVDLAAVAAFAGLSPEDVIARHAIVYEVLFFGFVGGFAYLGDVDPVLAAPRLSTPRSRVPAGAVGIADRRTAVYPGGTPGGWNLVATALGPLPVLEVGDRVRFVPA
jgi:UPF0271 protein